MVLVALGHVAKLIHVHLLFMFRLKFIFYFTFDCISLIAVAALKHSEIHFDLLFKFRMILNFSFTSGSTSILVLSWRSIPFYVLEISFLFSLIFHISFFYYFIFQFYLQLLHKNIRIFHWQFSATILNSITVIAIMIKNSYHFVKRPMTLLRCLTWWRCPFHIDL